jgi:signal transduction histidine kinase
MAREGNGNNGGSTTQPRGWDARSVREQLRTLERLFAQSEWPEQRLFMRARKLARRRSLEMLQSDASQADATRAALLLAAVELFRSRASARGLPAREAVELARRTEQITGVSSLALAREVLRGPELLALPSDLAIEVLLLTLVAFAPLRSVSLWVHDVANGVSCVRHLGGVAPSRGVRELGQRLLSGVRDGAPGDANSRALLFGVRVGRSEQPRAVLVGSARPLMRDASQVFFEESAPMLGAVLERDALRAENVKSQRMLVESSERKLTRLGFDLHDGPIQDVAVLAEDLRLFGDQLELALAPLPARRQVRGRIEDLDAQLRAIDSELRRLSTEVQAASVLLQRPFASALGERVRAFTARTGIRPRLTVTGEMRLSTSQEIALLNIIQEALSNIREHAGASKVEVTLKASEQGVRARVVDNGRGFDLESTLMLAAREGRIGLLAMNERVRLLGGQCRIDSRPGGPTVISVALERWLPLTDPRTAPDGELHPEPRSAPKAQRARASA